MTDTTDFPSRGRPPKSLKNYPDLMLKAAEEANRLQSEANSIAIRYLELRKQELLLGMINGGYTEANINRVKLTLDNI